MHAPSGGIVPVQPLTEDYNVIGHRTELQVIRLPQGKARLYPGGGHHLVSSDGPEFWATLHLDLYDQMLIDSIRWHGQLAPIR